MTRLTTDKLEFSYAARLVFQDVSLELRAGEVTVLLGANGAGKTTLLQSLCRQLQPASGDTCLDSHDLLSFSRRELARRITLMPQQENRDLPLQVREVVALGRTPHRGWWLPLSPADHDIVAESLAATGLSELAERPITTLSGGEWRRMILARALAQDTAVLLLDEPTAGLDLKYQFDVMDRVRRMTQQRSLITVVTLHDLNHAAMFADRVALLGEHSLLTVGTPEEVLQPDWIWRAYGVAVTILEHPVYGTPFVVPLHQDGSFPGASEHE